MPVKPALLVQVQNPVVRTEPLLLTKILQCACLVLGVLGLEFRWNQKMRDVQNVIGDDAQLDCPTDQRQQVAVAAPYGLRIGSLADQTNDQAANPTRLGVGKRATGGQQPHDG